MQRALVIRTYGDVNMAQPIANNFESEELKRLRTQVGLHEFKSNQYYRQKIQEIPKKYPIRKLSPAQHKFWALYGFVWTLFKS